MISDNITSLMVDNIQVQAVYVFLNTRHVLLILAKKYIYTYSIFNKCFAKRSMFLETIVYNGIQNKVHINITRM